MCLIVVGVSLTEHYPLIVAANRDEYYRRPTAAAEFWREPDDLLGGRDLEAGGTWLGMTRTGKFAAITNYRRLDAADRGQRSRGLLVTDFLTNSIPADGFLSGLKTTRSEYRGYSLMFGRWDELLCYSNLADTSSDLGPGIYGLSNHMLDTPWPKVVRAKQAVLDVTVSAREPTPDMLVELMLDQRFADDQELPDSGLDESTERALSPIFITTEHYGTRSTTIILVDQYGRVQFLEQSFSPDGTVDDVRRFDFTVQS